MVCRVSSNSESLLALSSVKWTREAAAGERNLVLSGAVLGGVGDVRTGTYVHVLSAAAMEQSSAVLPRR